MSLQYSPASIKIKWFYGWSGFLAPKVQQSPLSVIRWKTSVEQNCQCLRQSKHSWDERVLEIKQVQDLYICKEEQRLSVYVCVWTTASISGPSLRHNQKHGELKDVCALRWSLCHQKDNVSQGVRWRVDVRLRSVVRLLQDVLTWCRAWLAFNRRGEIWQTQLCCLFLLMLPVVSIDTGMSWFCS